MFAAHGRASTRTFQKTEGVGHQRRFGTQHGLVRIGREAGLLPLAELFGGEGGKIMVDERGVERMLGELRLNQKLTWTFGAAGAAGDLHQLREETLGRAPVGGKQGGIGSNGADQGELGEIVPFGEHLGADQNVGVAAVNPRHQHFPLLAAARHITIDAQHASLGKVLGEHRFQALRAAPEGAQVLVATGRAAFRQARFEAAVMAAQAAVDQMQHQIGGAAMAVRGPAASGTGQHRCVAPAIEEEQALLAARQALLDGA